MCADIYFGPHADAEYARNPLTLVDIGARGGIQPNWKRASRHLKLVGFEPDPAEYERLVKNADRERIVYINAAVGRAPGVLTLNIGREGGTSSIFEPSMGFLRRFPKAERYEIVRRQEISADTLDSLLARHTIGDIDFIKIDTQGAELDILQGARETLARAAFGVEVEVLFAPLYHGQSSFGSVDTLLRDAGFYLFDLRHSYWKRVAGARYGGPKGQLVFGDALYFKTEHAFSRQLDSLKASPDAPRAKLLHALSICVLYGYHDYAIELLGAHRQLIEPALWGHIDQSLRSEIDPSYRIPAFRGKGWLSHAFYRLHRAFFPTVEGWASGGRHIGNVD